MVGVDSELGCRVRQSILGMKGPYAPVERRLASYAISRPATCRISLLDIRKLHRQPVLGRVVARALDELHPGVGAGELPPPASPGRRTGGPAGLASTTAPRRFRRWRSGRAGVSAPGGSGWRRSGLRLRIPTHQGPQAPTCRACARNAAVWLAIVSSLFCRTDDTRA
jgi:hypothetical protein